MSKDDINPLIEEEIAKISSMADKLPGVVIIHDMRDWSIVWMSPQGLKKLCLTAEEINAMGSEEYHNRFFNSEDAKEYVPKVVELIERNNDKDTVTYFQQVKFVGYPEWNWHMSSTRIL